MRFRIITTSDVYGSSDPGVSQKYLNILLSLGLILPDEEKPGRFNKTDKRVLIEVKDLEELVALGIVCNHELIIDTDPDELDETKYPVIEIYDGRRE